MRMRLILAALGAAGSLPSQLNADDFFVKDGDVDGLIVAINAANANGVPDTIHLASEGTYTILEAHQGSTALPPVTSSIAIEGNHATIKRGETTLEFRILENARDGALVLRDLTIQGGYVRFQEAGGIHNAGFLTLNGCTIRENSAFGAFPEFYAGGGVLNVGTLTIHGSTIVRNVGDFGGGICSVGALEISRSTLVANSSVAGGALLLQRSATAIIRDSTLGGNRAYFEGGGIASWGTLLVTGSTIDRNSAGDGRDWHVANGGGISNYGTASLRNCTVSGNWADGGSEEFGGGLLNRGQATLTHCTLSQNRAARGGGLAATEGSLVLSNTIVAGSQGGGDVFGAFTDTGYNVIEDGTGVTHPTSISGDPHLGPLQYNGGPTWTHALLPDSIAIDVGDCDGGAVLRDQRGVPRPLGSACDIGAFEFSLFPPGNGDLNCDGTTDAFDIEPFILAVLDPNAYFAHFPLCDRNRADMNGDGSVNLRDIQPFVLRLVEP